MIQKFFAKVRKKSQKFAHVKKKSYLCTQIKDEKRINR